MADSSCPLHQLELRRLQQAARPPSSSSSLPRGPAPLGLIPLPAFLIQSVPTLSRPLPGQQHPQLTRMWKPVASLAMPVQMINPPSNMPPMPAANNIPAPTSAPRPPRTQYTTRPYRRRRRTRVQFTAEQLTQLRATFTETPYPDAALRDELATKLHLTEAQVNVWFANERSRWWKQFREQHPGVENADVAAMLSAQRPSRGRPAIGSACRCSSCQVALSRATALRVPYQVPAIESTRGTCPCCRVSQ